jgi:hypothetical protein
VHTPHAPFEKGAGLNDIVSKVTILNFTDMEKFDTIVSMYLRQSTMELPLNLASYIAIQYLHQRSKFSRELKSLAFCGY